MSDQDDFKRQTTEKHRHIAVEVPSTAAAVPDGVRCSIQARPSASSAVPLASFFHAASESRTKDVRSRPYFFTSFPRRLRSLPDIRAAWLMLPRVRERSSTM